jgi:hypothetical protein
MKKKLGERCAGSTYKMKATMSVMMNRLSSMLLVCVCVVVVYRRC